MQQMLLVCPNTTVQYVIVHTKPIHLHKKKTKNAMEWIELSEKNASPTFTDFFKDLFYGFILLVSEKRMLWRRSVL